MSPECGPFQRSSVLAADFDWLDEDNARGPAAFCLLLWLRALTCFRLCIGFLKSSSSLCRDQHHHHLRGLTPERPLKMPRRTQDLLVRTLMAHPR